MANSINLDSVGIVGAGLVGSLLAVILARNGVNVDIYEKRPDPRKTGSNQGKSINLALSERGLKALRLIGAEEDILRLAIPMEGRMIHSMDGKTAFQPYGEKGQVIYSVSRAELNKSLISKAEQHKNIRFHFAHKPDLVDPHSFKISFSDLENRKKVFYDHKLLFGADGAFSQVRGAFLYHPGFNYTQEYLEHGYKELSIPADKDGKHKLNKNALHIWPRGKFMLIALPNPDGSFTGTLFLPVKGEFSFESLNSEDKVLSFFTKYFPDAVPLMPDLVKDYNRNPLSYLMSVKCFPWSIDNKVCLIGDAAHAMVPFYGQGMNAGFEDCTILDEILQKKGNWEETLKEFQMRRKPSTDAVSQLAQQNFVEMRDRVGDEEFLFRKKVEAHMHEKLKESYLPLYSMVTFSHMPYEEALANGQKQDKLMEEVLKLEGIKSNWDKPEFWPKIEAVVKRYF